DRGRDPQRACLPDGDTGHGALTTLLGTWKNRAGKLCRVFCPSLSAGRGICLKYEQFCASTRGESSPHPTSASLRPPSPSRGKGYSVAPRLLFPLRDFEAVA